ncbi:MAG: AlbA family DNA-binding domain-containing protein, partial [Acidimicrobiales bacterium]
SHSDRRDDRQPRLLCRQTPLRDIIVRMIGKLSKRVLLTGAGWSRNWGGQLANEVWSSLVGHPRIRANAGLRDLLLDETAFEVALGKTHVAPFTAADRAEIEQAILDTFVAMDREIARRDPDRWINIYKVQELLFRFFGPRNEGNSSGYLFTLNQDLFFERHLCNEHVAGAPGEIRPRALSHPRLEPSARDRGGGTRGMTPRARGLRLLPAICDVPNPACPTGDPIMALSHIKLDDVAETHLKALIDNGARESLYIDYKRETYGGKDVDKKEFLADICSFANAAGGDIVIGMAENAGVPSEITPFTDDADRERLGLEQMARDGIEPRIIGLRIHVVTVEGGVIFVIRVPKSWNPPHRVTYKGSSRFHARTSGGKYEPSIEELRNLFLAAPHLQERIRAFRMERIARIAAGEMPVALYKGAPGRAVLHIAPYSAFGGADPYLIQKLEKNWQFFPPFARENATFHEVNFEGFVTLRNYAEDPSEHASYCQVFRHGALEAVNYINPDDVYSQSAFYRYFKPRILQSVFYLTNALARCDVAPPYVVMFSLLNTPRSNSRAPTALRSAYQDQYHFIEAYLETTPESTEAAAQSLIPLFDHIASLSGAISSGIEPKPTSP